MQLRLTKKLEYMADISSLRNAVLANRAKSTPCYVSIVIPNPPNDFLLQLVLNLAWERKSVVPVNMPEKVAIQQSLYTTGFVNNQGAHYFSDALWNPLPRPVINVGQPAVTARKLIIGGGYPELGKPGAINAAGLASSARKLSAMTLTEQIPRPGTPLRDDELSATDVSNLVFSLSEALRFCAIEGKVSDILGNVTTYDTKGDLDLANGWATAGCPLGAG